MRLLNDTEIIKLRVLTEKSLSVTLIEPTKTGLEKSIMDATGPIRNFLKKNNLHDFDSQKQGQENKIVLPAFLIESTRLSPTVISLYRPTTKKGDPRIWIKGLNSFTKANSIIGLFVFNSKVYVLNISETDIENLVKGDTNNPIREILNQVYFDSNSIAEELLLMLKNISKLGPIASSIKADTSIGRTLETLLGIDINSSKKPDYKGIELKSYRSKKGNRKTLFAQVPDWPISMFKSSSQILNNFGYQRGDDFKLYCTVSSITRNSQGLRLRLDQTENLLIENATSGNIGDFVVWKLDTLHKRLLEKHNETFWIAADSHIENGVEYFHYKKVEHTKKPIVTQFDVLIEQGIITLDHLIKKELNGKIVEKGPLFKIKQQGLNLLFPPSSNYIL